MTATADTNLFNGRITTNDRSNPEAQAVAITGERILAVGRNEDVLPLAAATIRQIDLAVPTSGHKSFWGALGCSCWAF